VVPSTGVAIRTTPGRIGHDLAFFWKAELKVEVDYFAPGCSDQNYQLVDVYLGKAQKVNRAVGQSKVDPAGVFAWSFAGIEKKKMGNHTRRNCRSRS
jgi:hypothetical protein